MDLSSRKRVTIYSYTSPKSRDKIREGDSVEFEVGEGPKGPNAINVKKVE